MKELFVDRNKRIAIYDDLFTLQERLEFFNFANKSYFTIGWADSIDPGQEKYKFLHSNYSQQDINNLGIIEKLKNSEAASELDGYVLSKTILNLSVPSDVNFVHAHPESKVLLYYVNLSWQEGWHGETLFFNEAGKDIVFANAYTPGRLIAFDASIPHTIRPQSYVAEHYRFTLSLFLNKC